MVVYKDTRNTNMYIQYSREKNIWTGVTIMGRTSFTENQYLNCGLDMCVHKVGKRQTSSYQK